MVQTFNVFFESPQVGEFSLLLMDHWSGYRDYDTIMSTIPEGKHMSYRLIPEGTTPLAQPLDFFGFRSVKAMRKIVNDRIIMDLPEFIIFQRNNVIRVVSLIHNQLCSPRFESLWRYAWRKIGYVPLEVEEFPTPVDFCFSKEQYGTRCQELCDGFSFIKCAWCKKLLCLKHFLDYHFCEQYIP